MRINILAFVAMVISMPALSLQQVGVTVGMVGSEGNGKQAYVGISPNTNACFAGGIYFTKEDGVAKMLSVAMAAKLAGKTIRVDYEKDDTTTKCVGRNIYIQ